MKKKILPPIKQPLSEFDPLEAIIRKLFRDEIFLPLIQEIDAPKKILNAADDAVLEAIRSGRVVFHQGLFTGKFNAAVSKQLKANGAVWDKKQSGFKLPLGKLSPELRSAISASYDKFLKTAAKLDNKLRQILPSDVAEKLQTEKFFDSVLYQTDQKVKGNLSSIIVTPTISEAAREKLAAEYTQNLQKYIKDWTEKEIVQLREDVKKKVLAGGRYEDMIEVIQKRYQVSANKAKFLARQESRLMISKFKEVRYDDAGVTKYIWTCVAGTKAHPVRPMHKLLDNKIFSWKNPPITDEKGNRNNPGEDYNCRCTARPIIEF